MKTLALLLNTFLLVLILAPVTGCQTGENSGRKKEASTLRLFLEANQEGTGGNGAVPIYRQAPVYLNVDKTPFLDEGNVLGSSVVDTLGSFAVEVHFDQHGTFVLDNITTANKGRHFAIFGQFGAARWLAAPVITRRIPNGTIVFTPDASREEAERLVRGLNSVAKALHKS